LNIFQYGTITVTRLKHNNQIELTYMEEMNNASYLVFGHIWCKYKTPQTKSV